jgi:hypothetical protein
MKNLLLMCMVLLGGVYTTAANSPAEDWRFRSFNDRFIFVENGIEFAVFPDGQFDFNYLDYGPNLNVNFGAGGTFVSFNTGFQYDRFVQYDIYGAVIQIEGTPIFYDAWGRVAQIGSVNINYRNGFINRLGGLRVFYNGPGVISHYRGFINTFNRFYVYQPWHRFYTVPVLNRCVVWNNPYRRFYNPIRFDWAYHRLHWNSPAYYNGYYLRGNRARSFYRPSDRVNYRSFETGRRNSRGLAVANRSTARNRAEIARGGRSIERGVATTRVDRTRNREVVSNARTTRSNNETLSRGNRSTRSENVRSTRSSRQVVTNERSGSRSEVRSNRSDHRSNARPATQSRNRSSATTGRSSNRSSATRGSRTSSSNRGSARTARTRS